MVGAASALSTTIAHVSRPDTTNAHIHTQYIIRVADERVPGLHWTVYRRYSEFRSLRVRLENALAHDELCAHCSLLTKRTCFMRFPRRHLFRSSQCKVLEERRIGLDQFLNAVTKHARTCKDRVTCKTRALMDQFLMVSDIRYTFLDVNMSQDYYPFIKNPHTNAESRHDKRESDPADDDDVDTTQLLGSLHQESNGPMIPNATAILSYSSVNSREQNALSGSSNNSVRSVSCLSSLNQRLSEDMLRSCGSAPRSSSAISNRHSDPGALCRNDFLSFRGGRRSRKVHLSSAAKRVKRLEEYSCQPDSLPKSKRLVPMMTIVEMSDE